MKDLGDRLKKTTQGSHQATSLEKGFRIRLKKLELVCELAAAPGEVDAEKNVRLFIKPVPCGPNCSDGCGCCYAWIKEQDEPLSHVVYYRSKLPSAGNEAGLAELVQAATAKLSQMRGESNGNGSAAGIDEKEILPS